MSIKVGQHKPVGILSENPGVRALLTSEWLSFVREGCC